MCIRDRYMGMELEAGEHEIELKYMTPGLKAGALCSLVGIILIISISIYPVSYTHLDVYKRQE